MFVLLANVCIAGRNEWNAKVAGSDVFVTSNREIALQSNGREYEKVKREKWKWGKNDVYERAERGELGDRPESMGRTCEF